MATRTRLARSGAPAPGSARGQGPAADDRAADHAAAREDDEAAEEAAGGGVGAEANRVGCDRSAHLHVVAEHERTRHRPHRAPVTLTPARSAARSWPRIA